MSVGRFRRPERIGEVLGRLLAGCQYIGVCRACWCRQPLAEGARCLRCSGLVARVRVS